MVAKILTVIIALTLITSFHQVAFAQASGSTKNKQSTNGPRKQLTIILFSGIAGAILGLSTLSFYGRPQDKLNNIAYGFAVGIIVGAGYSAYTVTSSPHEFSRGASIWDEQERDRLNRGAPGDRPMKMSWSWGF